MSKKWKEIPILVRNGQDPLRVAINYTHCLECHKALNMHWQCEHCKTQLFFRQPEIK